MASNAIHEPFIDFKKVFDSTHRESQWAITKKYEIPEKIVRMVQMLSEDPVCGTGPRRNM